MLPSSSALSRTASRWAFQVSASLGATLIAALLIQGIPRPSADAPQSAPELTSGGKFAARIAAVRAYDGLDTMPLPHVEAPRADVAQTDPHLLVPAAFLAPQPTDLAGLGTVLRQGSPTRERARATKTAHAPLRAEARRPLDVADAAGAAAVRDQTSADSAATGTDEGFLRKVASGTRQAWSVTASTTRDAWSATTSAGSSLVSRLIP